jgi:hypothetical protein
VQNGEAEAAPSPEAKNEEPEAEAAEESNGDTEKEQTLPQNRPEDDSVFCGRVCSFSVSPLLSSAASASGSSFFASGEGAASESTNIGGPKGKGKEGEGDFNEVPL